MIAPQKPKASWQIPVLIGFVVIVAFFVIIGLLSVKHKQANARKTYSSPDSIVMAGPDQTASQSLPYKSIEPISSWAYDSMVDKMTDKNIKYAHVEAMEKLDFKFPYQGGSTATLTIRKKGGSTDIYLEVSKGQFMTGLDGGNVKIKFDKAPAKQYSYSNSSDGSTDYVFIDAAKDIVSKIKASKNMIIEAEFYNEGLQQMEFDVEGFKGLK